MKMTTANPNDAYAYFKLAQSMCPELEVVILGIEIHCSGIQE